MRRQSQLIIQHLKPIQEATPMQARFLTLCAAVAGIGAGATAAEAAQVTVSFGGNMVATSVQYQADVTTTATESALGADFNGDGDTTDHVIRRALDLSTPWLATSASYTGPSLYGGFTAVSSSADLLKFSAGNVIENGSADYLRPVVNNLVSTSPASAVLFLFKVASPGPGQYTEFTAGDALSWGGGAVGNNRNNTRLLVQADGDFYVSASTNTSSISVDPSVENWALWDIENGDANLLVPGTMNATGLGSLNYNVLGSTLKNIGFVGMVGYNNHSTTAASAPSMGTFSAAITVVPEPAALSLLALAAVPMMRRRRV
jgi:MYXO-CTERM domain-containing protein